MIGHVRSAIVESCIFIGDGYVHDAAALFEQLVLSSVHHHWSCETDGLRRERQG